jgi:hypothetical protein
LGPDDGSALVHLDGVLAATQGILDDTFHLQQIAFAHGLGGYAGSWGPRFFAQAEA